MFIIEEMVAPQSLGSFLETYFGKVPCAAPFQALRFKDLISWGLLEEILQKNHPDCWLPYHGRLPEEKMLRQGTLSVGQAQRGVQEGRTLLVRHSEQAHSALAEIAKDFRESFHLPVDIQLYYTPGGEEGFDWHYDLEDVFVIQSVGEKEFRLKANTVAPRPLPRPLPKDLHFEEERNRMEIRCLLKAGDWLYIPSGYWHKARALSTSAHLSVGVLTPPH